MREHKSKRRSGKTQKSKNETKSRSLLEHKSNDASSHHLNESIFRFAMLQQTKERREWRVTFLSVVDLKEQHCSARMNLNPSALTITKQTSLACMCACVQSITREELIDQRNDVLKRAGVVDLLDKVEEKLRQFRSVLSVSASS